MKFILSFLLTFFMIQFVHADAVIFSGSDVKTLKQNIDLFGVAKILSGSVDPSAGAGVVAPQGSIYLSTNGNLYTKYGAGNTQWSDAVLNPEAWLTAGNVGTGADNFILGNSSGVIADITGKYNGIDWMLIDGGNRLFKDTSGVSAFEASLRQGYATDGTTVNFDYSQISHKLTWANVEVGNYISATSTSDLVIGSDGSFGKGDGAGGFPWGILPDGSARIANGLINLNADGTAGFSGYTTINADGSASFASGNTYIDNSGNITANAGVQTPYIKDNVSVTAIDVNNRQLMDSTGIFPALEFDLRFLDDSAGSNVLGWSDASGIRVKTAMQVGDSAMGLAPVSAMHIDKGNATASALRFTAGTTTGRTTSDGFQLGITAAGVAEVRQREAQALELYTSNALRAQWTSAGNLFLDGSIQARGGAGSAAVPFWGFTNSSDVGMYRGAGSTLGLSTTGTQRVMISSAGVWDFGDTSNFKFGTTTGLKFGDSTTNKLAFYNSTPIVQPGATTDLGVVLSNLGLRAAGTAYPISTSGNVTLTPTGAAIQVINGTGSPANNVLEFQNASAVKVASVKGDGSASFGTNAAATSAILDASSTTKGFLKPRMTTAQRTAISSPATGLEVYDTDLKKTYYYNGTSWKPNGGAFEIIANATQNTATTLTPASSTAQVLQVSGNGSAVSIGIGTTNATDGDQLVIAGTDDTNTVTITDGGGVVQNGAVTLGDGDMITYIFFNTKWREQSRNN